MLKKSKNDLQLEFISLHSFSHIYVLYLWRKWANAKKKKVAHFTCALKKNFLEHNQLCSNAGWHIVTANVLG